MADIRSQEVQTIGVGYANSPIKRARATSSDRMSDKYAVEAASKAIAAEKVARAAAQELPVWVIRARDAITYAQKSGKPELTIRPNQDGWVYFYDAMGCRIPLCKKGVFVAAMDMPLVFFLTTNGFGGEA